MNLVPFCSPFFENILLLVKASRVSGMFFHNQECVNKAESALRHDLSNLPRNAAGCPVQPLNWQALYLMHVRQVGGGRVMKVKLWYGFGRVKMSLTPHSGAW
jgi:hypothetical protein